MGASEVLDRIWRDVSVPFKGDRLPLRAPTVKSIHVFRERVRGIDEQVDGERAENVLRLELLSAAALEACSDLSEDESLVVIRTAGKDLVEIARTAMDLVGHGHFFDGADTGDESATAAEDSDTPDIPLS